MNKKRNKQYNNEKGFTLLEVITAIFLIAVALVTIFTLITQTISYTNVSTSKLVASYLAQEGIEIVRNIRDGNWLEETAWDEGLTNCSGGCVVDYNHSYGPDQQDPNLPAFNNQFLKMDSSGFYNYLSGSNTKFKRKITIIQDSNEPSQPLNVSVSVIWVQAGKSYQVTAQEYLYNWIQ